MNIFLNPCIFFIHLFFLFIVIMIFFYAIKKLSFFLILCLMLAALTGVCAEGTSADIVEIQKYGNLVLSMSGSAFLDQGFA